MKRLKVLLDENIAHPLRHHLSHHETYTGAYMGWAGLKNGEFLSAAETAGFDVLVTGDRALQYEQNLSGRTIISFTRVDVGQFRSPRGRDPLQMGNESRRPTLCS